MTQVLVRGVLLLAPFLFGLSMSELAAAQEADSQDRSPATKKTPKQKEVDRDAVLRFTAEHHPELSRLLEQLQKSRPSEFARATREISQQIQVLERLRERNPSRYQSQLENWKLDSQIRVLTARWSKDHDKDLEKQIRTLLLQRHEQRLAQMKQERERAAEQLNRLDEQIATFSDSIETQVDSEWEQLSTKAEKPSPRKTKDTAAAAGGKK